MIIEGLVGYSDPLKKREEFAVSLRKQKKEKIIQAKRKRISCRNTQGVDQQEEQYIECPLFCPDDKEDQEQKYEYPSVKSIVFKYVP